MSNGDLATTLMHIAHFTSALVWAVSQYCSSVLGANLWQGRYELYDRRIQNLVHIVKTINVAKTPGGSHIFGGNKKLKTKKGQKLNSMYDF